MTKSPRLSLSYLAPAQAQKHVTVNENLRRLDALVQMSVLSKDVRAEPLKPSEGDAYILGKNATGTVWQGVDAHTIAVFQDSFWAIIPPLIGMIAWVADEAAFFVYTADGWSNLSMVVDAGEMSSPPVLGVNTAADVTNRLSVKADAALFSHDDVTPGGGGVQLVVNKKTVSDTASIVFQTGFSGRAEIGLVGNDFLTVKSSGDGINFQNTISVDNVSGKIGIGVDTPTTRLDIRSGFGDGIRISDNKTYTELSHFDGGSSGNDAYCDYNLLPGTPNGGAFIRYFRNTSTTGPVGIVILRADGGSSPNSLLSANSDSFFNAAVGSVGIGIQSPAAKLHVDGGVLIGSPSGGDKGRGTLNAQAIYDDNALLSCYVFEQVLDGRMDFQKWDQKTPGKTGQADEIDRHRHTPMRKFAARIGSNHDPLTLDGYARHWKQKRHLTSMPNEESFDPEKGMATGEWVQRLVETVEIQAVLIERLNGRLKRLETHAALPV